MKRLLFSLACVPFVLAAAPLTLVSPQDGATMPTLSDGQKAYQLMPRAERVAYFACESGRKAMKALGYYPQPITLAWKDGEPGATYKVVVSRVPDGKVFFTYEGTNTAVAVDNLEIARTYEWKVTGGGELTAKFATEDLAPRLIRIPGVPNVRDLGGRLGRDGRRVKQGLVIRSAGLNDNARAVYYTKEELAASGLQAKLDAEKVLLKRQKVQWKTWADDPKTVKAIVSPLGRDWSIQFVDGQIQPVRQEKDGNFRLASAPTGKIVLSQTFEAPEAGVFLADVTRTQPATISVNGEVVHDFAGIAASRHRLTSKDSVIALPVRKGRNEIAVAIPDVGGSKRVWRMSHASRSGIAQAFSSMLHNVQLRRDCLEKVWKGRLPGKNRLTEETLPYMLNELGIKSDIDLRSDGECYGMTGSPLGPTVTWFHYSSQAYGGMQSTEGKDAFRKVFRVFLDEKNYPIDFHCIAGQDRTGAVAFILNGLLGVKEEDLYLDWESTGYWNGSTSFNHKNLFDHLVSGFMKKVEGATLHEKIENYVLGLGFTKDDIEKFRAFMLESSESRF